MNNNDTRLIFERYAKKADTPVTDEQLNEGFFDRVKAKGAGVVGDIKGLGQQAKGYVKSAVAGVKGDTQGVVDAQQQVKKGKTVGKIAKVSSYKKTALKKIDALTAEITNDLTALGINPADLKVKNNSFKKNLAKALDDLISQISA